MFRGNIILGGVDLYSDFKVLAVDTSSGMKESHFGVSQKLLEDKVSSCDKPLFYGVERQPFKFTITLAREASWDYQTKKRFIRTVIKDRYQELISSEVPQIIYKVICISDAKKILNNLDQGYIKLEFRTNAPWGYAPVVTKSFEITEPTTILLENQSNIAEWYYPEIQFITKSDHFKLTNVTDSSRQFEFTELMRDETVYVDNDNKRIRSDQPYPFCYRLSNFNRKWLRLKYGQNSIKIHTPSTVIVKMQYPIAL